MTRTTHSCSESPIIFDKFMERSGLSQNTRRIHFANIRAAINEAYKRELTDADPFRRFKIKTEKTAKRSLPVEELRKLFDYEGDGELTDDSEQHTTVSVIGY